MRTKLGTYLQLGGIIIVLSSIVRWGFIYYDPSQAVLGIAIGIIFIGFGDIYNTRKIFENRLNDLDKRVDSFVKWMTKKELE